VESVHLQVVIGLVLALACAGGASLSGLWKQKGAVEVGDVDIRRPVQTALALFRSKWFAIGWILAVIAWLLHVGALALAPLSLAQAVIAGGLVSLGLLAERYFGFSLKRRQWLGLVVIACGLAVLAVSAHGENNHTAYGVVPILAFETACVALGVGCVLTYRIERLGEHHGLLLGIAAGIWFGVADVTIKAVTSGSHGLLGVLGPWTLLGLLTAVGAFYASARSLQIGDAVAVIAATATAANVLGIIGGIVVFGDPLGNNIPTIVARVGAFVLVIVAIGLMPAPVRAQQAAAEEESTDSPSMPPTRNGEAPGREREQVGAPASGVVAAG
jgi:drug/metabolite transporter (DMT)-like permease